MTTLHPPFVYYRYDAYLGSFTPMTKKEFERKIKSKYIHPVFDDYWQEISENTFFDSRDSIVRIFYMRREKEDDNGKSIKKDTKE